MKAIFPPEGIYTGRRKPKHRRGGPDSSDDGNGPNSRRSSPPPRRYSPQPRRPSPPPDIQAPPEGTQVLITVTDQQIPDTPPTHHLTIQIPAITAEQLTTPSHPQPIQVTHYQLFQATPVDQWTTVTPPLTI